MRDVAFRDRAVYLEPTSTLVVADLHIGRDEASAAAFPLGERADLGDRLRALLSYFDPARTVFAGDILHSFSDVSATAAANLAELVDACAAVDSDAVLIAGNHDALLESIWDGQIHDAVALADETVVCHGHAVPETIGDRYVIGHNHPAITIEGVRRPCYLYGEGTYDGCDVLVLPAFNRLAAGAVVNSLRTAQFQSPLITDADALRPIVYDRESHETLRFPPLARFRDML
ncbi:metallophosphoesterase [Haloferacaceae archaeon DSL9]